MIDIEKMAKENGFVTHLADDCECYADYDTLKDFAEAYHKAMREQSQDVGFVVSSKFGEMCMFKSTETKKGDMVYTTPQPLKRLDSKQIEVMIYEYTRFNVNQQEDGETVKYIKNLANAIMDEMERINK